MARARSKQKRQAILEAAAREIAENGLGAPTARIAQRAEVAEGTLFVYFPSKHELLNALYAELKLELYQKINKDFPHASGLEERLRHLWISFMNWAIDAPYKRRASIQLNVSDIVTAATRQELLPARGNMDTTLRELENCESLQGMPAGSAGALVGAMQEATMDLIARHPRKRKELVERSFGVLRRALL